MADFAASVHCMDGRVQEPVIKFIKEKYGVKYVDTITEPGPNKILAGEGTETLIDSIINRLNISVNKHGSDLIFVSGHTDCAGNPVENTIQFGQINKSAEFLQGKYPGVKIVKLWINENWEVEKL